VCCAGEVWEGVFQGQRVVGSHQHECHGGAEEDDVRGGVFAEFFALEISFCISKASCERAREELLFPESDCLQGERLAGGEEG
jgi:hypothetical protein